MKLLKPKIGLLGLTLNLYRKKLPEYLSGMKKLSHNLSARLSHLAEVKSWPLAWSQNTAGQALNFFHKEKVDGVVIVFLSYATSLSVLPVLKVLRKPLLLWNTQKARTVSRDFSSKDLMENHGIHGVQDLASVLLREGISFHLITGHWQEEKTLARIQQWCLAASASSKMSQTRIGRVGGRFKEMGDFALPDTLLTKWMGAKVVDLDSSFLRIKGKDISPGDNFWEEENYVGKEKISAEIKNHSLAASYLLQRKMEEENLSGIAINFAGLRENQIMPFFGICQLLAAGYGYGGEGDIFSATVVFLSQIISGRQATFTEMFTADFSRRRILMNHMGEANLNLRRPDLPVKLTVNHMKLGNNVPTIVPVFTLKPGVATLVNLTGTGSGLRLITSRVKILKSSPLKLDSPHFFLQPEKPVCDFLSSYSLAGGSHHLAVAYGDWQESIKYLGEMKKIPVVEI